MMRYLTVEEIYDEILAHLARGVWDAEWRVPTMTTFAHKKGLGWNPQIPDKRDLFYHLQPPTTALPTVVDMRDKCPPVYDQMSLGSCTGFACGGAFEFLDRSEGRYSELFIYYEARKIEHNQSHDAGAYLRDCIKGAVKVGLCDEQHWPYDESKVAQAPSAAARKNAKTDKLVKYMALPQNKVSMHTALAGGEAFIIGFTVYTSFMTQAVATSGIAPMPDFSKEATVGGHAVLVVGYNDADDTYIVRNSWSTSWGQAGYFTIPQRYFEDPNLASDLWVVQLVQ